MSNSGKIADKVKSGDYQPTTRLEDKVTSEAFWEPYLAFSEKYEGNARDVLAFIDQVERKVSSLPRAMRDARDFVEREIARYEYLRKNRAFKKTRKI